MSDVPNLGETWKEAVKSAYTHGYQAFEWENPEYFLSDEDIEDLNSEDCPLELHDFEDIQLAISESHANKTLWWAIDEFYANHMPEEQYERLKREAAVAEDLDSAFSAGAYAALQGEQWNPEEDVGFLYE